MPHNVRTVRPSGIATAAAVAVFAALITSSPAAQAATTCPSLAAVSAALGSKAEVDETPFEFSDCAFKAGDKAVSFTITPTADVTAELAAQRADAMRRTAGVQLTKVGRYKAFTGTASGVSQLFYDQSGTTVFVSHQQISANSADILKRVATALAAVKWPKKTTNCAAFDKVVAKTEPSAKRNKENSGCIYNYADGTYLGVGISTEDTFTGWLETYRGFARTGPIKDATVGTHKGFMYGTKLVIGLTDAVVIINTNEFFDTVPLVKWTASRAAVALG